MSIESRIKNIPQGTAFIFFIYKKAENFYKNFYKFSILNNSQNNLFWICREYTEVNIIKNYLDSFI